MIELTQHKGVPARPDLHQKTLSHEFPSSAVDLRTIDRRKPCTREKLLDSPGIKRRAPIGRNIKLNVCAGTLKPRPYPVDGVVQAANASLGRATALADSPN